ncbi:MAG: hypothetical protein JWP89_7029 [Schlesneria sp.]|nr:hypothetical protein [Schlesneria sp.]
MIPGREAVESQAAATKLDHWSNPAARIADSHAASPQSLTRPFLGATFL